MASFLDNLFSLHGKTVLITGANRGLGAGMAEALGKAGASLVLVLRDVSKTESVDRYKQMGIETSSIQCDLGDPEQVGKLIAEAVELHRIDVLVNCGGIQRRYKAHDFPVKEFNEVVQVNYLTPAQLMRDIGAYWIKEKIQGKIINIASIMSFQGGIEVSSYAGTKHGIVGLTKAFANEWAEHGICVNAIAPGYVATDLIEALLQDEKRNEAILGRIPAGRYGDTKDFWGVAVYLASNASDYCNGSVITVDGGWVGR